ncbi:MAG: hypothetical protein KKA42_14840 [candidate division Zixibacteria bacterium]|nr:hypothetical protein [candidate division Zixibacteria bacterium]
MRKGLQTEREVLESADLSKNTTKAVVRDPKTGEYGNTIPDSYLPDGTPVEVKDRARISDSPQLRRQNELAKRATGGQAIVVRARDNGIVSSTVMDNMDVRDRFFKPLR